MNFSVKKNSGDDEEEERTNVINVDDNAKNVNKANPEELKRKEDKKIAELLKIILYLLG